MSPAASASYRLPHPRRCTGGKLKYANDGTRPATVAASSNSNSASRRAPKQSYTPARNCRRVLKVAGSIMPDPTGRNRPASRNHAYPPCGGWVDLGGCPPRPPGRSGHAQFGHPAPQITDSLRDAGGNGWQRVAVAGEPARTVQTVPRTISLSESAY